MITAISEHCWVHTSYLSTKKYGDVPCNGMLVWVGDEVLIIDTPVDSLASEELIRWVQQKKKTQIKAVVATHFHVDCLGGLSAFHRHGIPSWSNQKTIALANADRVATPDHGFKDSLWMNIGDERLQLRFPGEGHTRDNIVAYFPKDQVLFGGCLVKGLGWGKGNLKDANTKEWSNSVRNVKTAFPQTLHVVPGHGKVGDRKNLDYTIKMFDGDQ